MKIPEIKYCPGTLAAGNATYSPNCIKRMFGGKRVSHILPFDVEAKDEEIQDKLLENRQRLSISGFQVKYSLVVEKGVFRLTNEGEQGAYIMKPPSRDLNRGNQFPANEHVTMQIARQVYGIETAESAVVFSPSGMPCYITKRFDVKPGGGKWAVEDFAALAGKTKDISGENFKYEYSYEEIAQLIKKYCPAAVVEVERFFALVVFNYLFSNGDAHLKNFSVIETIFGDHRLSPAYDLVNSRLHLNDSDFALNKGLFADTIVQQHQFPPKPPTGKEFREFAQRIGVTGSRIDKVLQPFIDHQAKVDELVSHSFLSESSQNSYLKHYRTRRNLLNQG